MTDDNTYTVTDQDGGRSYEVEADDVDEAATTWAEIMWRDLEHPEEVTCIVRCPYGSKWVVTVTVAMLPTFLATKAEEAT